MKVTVSRRAHFNAAHRLFRADWSDEKNDAVFGKCNNPNYHGHNYELIVSVNGAIDPATGFVMDLKELKDIIKQEVEDPFDHKNSAQPFQIFCSMNHDGIAAPLAGFLLIHFPKQFSPPFSI